MPFPTAWQPVVLAEVAVVSAVGLVEPSAVEAGLLIVVVAEPSVETAEPFEAVAEPLAFAATAEPFEVVAEPLAFAATVEVSAVAAEFSASAETAEVSVEASAAHSLPYFPQTQTTRHKSQPRWINTSSFY
jgi:hypothetical protein